MERMKIRAILDNELDILFELFYRLVCFHAILIVCLPVLATLHQAGQTTCQQVEYVFY